MKTLFKIGDEVSWDSSVGTVNGVIEQVVLEGLIPKIGINVATTKTTPGYLIKLANRQDDVFVGKLHSDLQEQKTEVLAIDAKSDNLDTFPRLTKQQLAKLNKFRPLGFPPVPSEQMTVVSFFVADNLVNRGRGKWMEKDLVVLAKMLDTMGVPHTLDHDWEDIAKTQGLVIEGKIVKEKTAPDNLISAAGNKKLNSEIVKKEGFLQVLATVAFPIDSPIVQRLGMGIGRAVSLGGFAFEDYVCPICETSFTYKNCPHYIPGCWDAWGEDPSLVAPYYIRDGLYDLGELSSVLIANLPGATAVVGNGV